MIRIVVLDRGFVSVGQFSENGEWCELDHAAVVRRWGTTRGLGQIAEEGPTSNTILDKTPRQRFRVASIVNTIECDEAKWASALGLGSEAKEKK